MPTPPSPDAATKNRDRAGIRRSETILFYGQSNAGGGGNDPPLLTEPMFPDRALTFESRAQFYGDTAAEPKDFSGIAPLFDHANYSSRAATAMAYALAGAEAPPASSDLALFLFTVWHGNQPLPTFQRGTPAFGNLRHAVRRSRVALAAEGYPGPVTALVFLQGESGPRGRAAYRTAFVSLLDDTLEAVRKAAAQDTAPVCLLLQVNRNAEADKPASGVELAQWDVAQARADTVLAGPSYHLPLFDRIHHRAIGRMIAGEQLALAYTARVRDGIPFRPLHPAGATRTGRAIRIAFALPPGGNPLAWDTAWVCPSANFGFAYEDSAGPAALREVAITGAAEVTLTLDRAAKPGGVVRYAQGQTQAPGWASARGQLISPTEKASFFHARGYPVPAFVNHYCIRAQIDLDT